MDKDTSRISIESITMVKTICSFFTQKKIEAEKNGDKDGKPFYKLMNIVVYGKTMEKLTNRLDVKVKLANNEKDHLKST